MITEYWAPAFRKTSCFKKKLEQHVDKDLDASCSPSRRRLFGPTLVGEPGYIPVIGRPVARCTLDACQRRRLAYVLLEPALIGAGLRPEQHRSAVGESARSRDNCCSGDGSNKSASLRNGPGRSSRPLQPDTAVTLGTLTNIRRRALAALMPPPRLRLSEWIEREIVLPERTSALPGRVRLWPHQREIADAISEAVLVLATADAERRLDALCSKGGVIACPLLPQ